jgi:hypothetical protein
MAAKEITALVSNTMFQMLRRRSSLPFWSTRPIVEKPCVRISGILLPVEVRKFVQLASFSLHVLEQNPFVKPQRKRELEMCSRLPYLITFARDCLMISGDHEFTLQRCFEISEYSVDDIIDF